jgi:hypothetical protein
MPILMVAPCARALPMMWGAAIPAAMPAAKSRLVSFIYSSMRPSFFVGLSWYWHPQRAQNRVRIYELSRSE